jgi:hypothetical protein
MGANSADRSRRFGDAATPVNPEPDYFIMTVHPPHYTVASVTATLTAATTNHTACSAFTSARTVTAAPGNTPFGTAAAVRTAGMRLLRCTVRAGGHRSSPRVQRFDFDHRHEPLIPVRRLPVLLGPR